MKMQSSTRQLLGTASVLALSATAFLASAALRPANAQAISQGIYAGGSTLASEAMRQIFDCYAGTQVGNDHFSVSTGALPTTPAPGFLPSGCGTGQAAVQGMYSGVGSGNGFRGFISNNPDQWYGGTLTPSTTADTTIATPNPASQPPFIDSSNSANFGSYPYPRVDIGFSDSPLANVGTAANFTTTSVTFPSSASNWQTTSSISLGSTVTTSTYNLAAYGNPIQVPAFEVNVAIAANTNSMVVNSAVSGATGGAIQLSEAQLCAIFSGQVTDWDSTASIPNIDNAGHTLATLFDDANAGNGHTGQYSATSLPITVVFRSDGSGTSFILTNYLANVCPLLDVGDANKYKEIFTGVGLTIVTGTTTTVTTKANLPNTSFSNLVSNITNIRGAGPWNATTGAHWLGESGSGGVAATIGQGSGQGGYIGYVSADFTSPYAATVSGAGLTNVSAPLEASLQDENQRANSTAPVYLPPATATTLTFIPPTPGNADLAWQGLAVPNNSSTYNDYNVYGQTITATTLQGGVSVTGLSALPLTFVQGAYPLSGTTFMTFYSCYQDSTRVTNINAFFSWYFNANNGGDTDIIAIIQNAGFNVLPATWAGQIVNQYSSVDGGTQPIKAAGTNTAVNCSGTGAM